MIVKICLSLFLITLSNASQYERNDDSFDIKRLTAQFLYPSLFLNNSNNELAKLKNKYGELFCNYKKLEGINKILNKENEILPKKPELEISSNVFSASIENKKYLDAESQTDPKEILNKESQTEEAQDNPSEEEYQILE